MFNFKFRQGSADSRVVRIRPEVAHRFHTGDVQAFSEIYSQFKTPLFSFLLRRTENVSAAEDLSHDIFLKLLKSRELYDPTQEFSPWFWTVARNTLNDHLRRKLNVTESVQVDGPDADQAGISVLVSTADIESVVLKHSDRTVLLKFMDQLTRLQREALSMRLVHKLPYAEISKRMCLSLSAVKSLIHRAQGTLKSAFRKEQKREIRLVEALEEI